MARLLKAATLTITLTLTLTTTVKPTMHTSPKARTNLQMAEQIKEFTQVTGLGHTWNTRLMTALIGKSENTVVPVGTKGRWDMEREAVQLEKQSANPLIYAEVEGHRQGWEEGLYGRAAEGAASASDGRPQDGGVPTYGVLGLGSLWTRRSSRWLSPTRSSS